MNTQTRCGECDSPKWATLSYCIECENPMCDKCPGAGEDAKGNLLCAKCVAKRNRCFFCDKSINMLAESYTRITGDLWHTACFNEYANEEGDWKRECEDHWPPLADGEFPTPRPASRVKANEFKEVA
jgi:hypothetical protein